MKKLYLMRHSKAGQTDKHLLNDHERPLTKKGEEQVPLIAEYFNKHYKDNPPQIILSSTALRAKQTSTIFKKNFKLKDPDIQVFQELYITGADAIISVIHKINEKFDSALIVSHNPGLHHFALNFARQGDKKKYREMKASMPPGSFAVFEVDVDDWYQITPESGTLLDFVSGKGLKE